MRRRTKNTRKKKKYIYISEIHKPSNPKPMNPDLAVVDHGAVGTSDVTNYHWRFAMSWSWCYCGFSGESTLRRCCPRCQHPCCALVSNYSSISSLYLYISLLDWELGLRLASWVGRRDGSELGLWWRGSGGAESWERESWEFWEEEKKKRKKGKHYILIRGRIIYIHIYIYIF